MSDRPEEHELAAFDGAWLDGLEFCLKAYRLFEKLRSEPDGVSRLRMRKRVLEKKLIEEILPIAKYVQTKYCPGRYLSVRWFRGSQSFDAEMRQNGSLVDRGYFVPEAFLEVSCVVHPNDYLVRERLDADGFAFGAEGVRRAKDRRVESEPVVRIGMQFVESFSGLVLNAIRKKGGIGYPARTTLILECSFDVVYIQEEWVEFERLVTLGCPDHPFDEIFVYETLKGRSFSIWGKPSSSTSTAP